jgi:putative transposase
VPQRLVRYQNSTEFHFLTFSCYQRSPLLANGQGYEIFEQELERVRQRYKFVVAGYVLMPEHVHLLVSEPNQGTLCGVIQVLKQQSSRKLKKPDQSQFWQRRYYDFNVWKQSKIWEKLTYMHQNPVVRGLVTDPKDWPWSSFRHYATGEVRTIEFESEWAAQKEEAEFPKSSGYDK